jgi:hypothetical protein
MTRPVTRRQPRRPHTRGEASDQQPKHAQLTPTSTQLDSEEDSLVLKGAAMSRKWLLVVLTAALGAAAAVYGGIANGTPIQGVTTPINVHGTFPTIDATVKTPTGADKVWQARLNTKGSTDVYVLENVISPGGTFGWHSHPGPSLVIVNAGTLSVYHAPDCIPEDFGPGSPNGSTFIDQGHDLHMVRNNSTTTVADVYVVSLVPQGFPRRIDEPNPNPSVCPN